MYILNIFTRSTILLRKTTILKIFYIILPVCAFRKWIVLQSEPLSDNPYAKMLPSSLKLLLVIATVPSSERVLGSRNTLGSLSRISCTYKTLQ